MTRLRIVAHTFLSWNMRAHWPTTASKSGLSLRPSPFSHAGGATPEVCVESAKKSLEKGFRFVRIQLGNYGGGGFLPLHCIAPSLSVRVAHNGAEPFELQQVTLYMQGGSGPQ